MSFREAKDSTPRYFAQVKDKNKPKRAMTAYFYFAGSIREELREDNPDLKKGDLPALAKLTSARWAKLTDQDKQPFQDQFEADKIRYAKDMETYVPPPPTEITKRQAMKRQKSKKVKDPNKPKQATSAYFYFLSEIRPKLVKDESLSNTGLVKKAGAMWSMLSEDERLPYKAKAAMDKLRYKEEMLTYVPPVVEEPEPEPELAKKSMGPLKPKKPTPPEEPLSAEQLFISTRNQGAEVRLPQLCCRFGFSARANIAPARCLCF